MADLLAHSNCTKMNELCLIIARSNANTPIQSRDNGKPLLFSATSYRPSSDSIYKYDLFIDLDGGLASRTSC